jgi:hypothetical protein
VSRVWWVNHSGSYDNERRGGFISAPKAPDEDSPFHELLHRKLRSGDARASAIPQHKRRLQRCRLRTS